MSVCKHRSYGGARMRVSVCDECGKPEAEILRERIQALEERNECNRAMAEARLEVINKKQGRIQALTEKNAEKVRDIMEKIAALDSQPDRTGDTLIISFEDAYNVVEAALAEGKVKTQNW